MINKNLKQLRKRHQFTQEYIAEQLQVSRQAVAKWEKGESMPDLVSCIELAKLYDITLDNLVHHDDKGTGVGIPPKGKHLFDSITV